MCQWSCGFGLRRDMRLGEGGIQLFVVVLALINLLMLTILKFVGPLWDGNR